MYGCMDVYIYTFVNSLAYIWVVHGNINIQCNLFDDIFLLFTFLFITFFGGGHKMISSVRSG